MAATPKVQLKKMLIGTLGAFLSMLGLIYVSQHDSQFLFYLLSTVLIISVLYALPGYLGIWLWRMRKTLFNID